VIALPNLCPFGFIINRRLVVFLSRMQLQYTCDTHKTEYDLYIQGRGVVLHYC